jgi:hypothetical protein
MALLLVGMTALPALAQDSPKTEASQTAASGATVSENSSVPSVADALKRKAGLLEPQRASGLLLARATAPALSGKKQDEKKEDKKEDAASTEGVVTTSGLLDWYYGVNFRGKPQGTPGIVTPSGETIGVDNFARYFDINANTPSFSLGLLNINRSAGKGFPLGVTATFTFGDSARLFHATEPGGTSSYSMLHNLFLTYNTKILGKDVAIDFGKFASPFGSEVLESSNNDNYSRAFTFWYGVPFYHAGLRATVPLSNKITLQAGLTNGWNNVADDNGAKSPYLQFTIKPNPRFTQIIGWIGSREGTGAYGSGIASTRGGGEIDTHLLDFQSIYQINDRTKIGGWIAYGNAAGRANGAPFSGNWLGLVAYVKHQFNPRFSGAFRIEQFEDIPGVGGNGPRFQLGGYRKFRGYTLTLEYQSFRGRAVSRLELRHDSSSSPDFIAGAGNAAADQTTLTFAQVFRF